MLREERKRLKAAAAATLGHILWELGSLEASLGLALAWSRGGSALEAMLSRAEGLGFDQRLRLLERVLDEVSRSAEVTARTRAWIADAHALRLTRNDFVHGRWAVTGDGMIANVVGIPGSAQQAEKRYALADLEQILQLVKDLRKRLNLLYGADGIE
ncbi:MAG TPA: hypothetical protein VM576_00350 [Xanthomonadaceae bacterium]|nr:hypothetical protein [Xanthomonadaceae bacterium]